MAPIYWFAQAAFVCLLFLARLTPIALPLSMTFVLLGLAAAQFALVTWRLRIAGQRPWIALAPPVTTAALWLALGSWAAGEVGGDGRGFVAAIVAIAWGLISYVAVGLWAGFQPTDRRER